MKVYVITCYVEARSDEGDSTVIIGVYKSKERAELMVKGYNLKDKDEYKIEEHTLY